MIESLLENKRILITCGSTWVAIDDMRVISNKSTGVLGQQLANSIHNYSSDVTLLEGAVESRVINNNITVKPFRFYDEFSSLFKRELALNYDIVIHAAAVSDYKMVNESSEKISSSMETLTLNLIPTEKLIYVIKKISPKTTLVGFKLESQMDENIAIECTKNLFDKAGCDYVIANSVRNEKYKGYLIDKNKSVVAMTESRCDLIIELINALNNVKVIF